MTAQSQATMDYPGNLYVVAAPSGAGKSSLVKALLELDSRLQVSVSHTTRAPRGQERHGREYWFIDRTEFRTMIDRGDFFEWAEVHGNLYGTSRAAMEPRLSQGEDVVLEIDYQGALQIKQIFPTAVLIFILPPSWEELRQRLMRRGEDAGEADKDADLGVFSNKTVAVLGYGSQDHAHALNLKVVAEGVETIAEMRCLQDQGCDEMQGYLFSPPLLPDKFQALVLSNHALSP